jgi:cellulose synthase/poly-beta-1,6-N-acetylglucosamine synthase-like glycosyltransferase
VLTVDARADPLFAACEALAREVAPGRATVVAVDDAPTTARASGKCAAQLRGLGAVAPDREVLVFADDDIRPPPGWVAALVGGLADPLVGVATAYRWYLPQRRNFASHVRSAWNLVGLQIMFSDRWNFAWGGGMAVRRADFDAWKVAEGWERAISDDYVVTIAAKREKRPIRFVPAALAPAPEDVDRPAMLEWCRRQTFMTRIYDPGLWKFAIAPYLYFNGLLAVGAAALASAALGAAVPLWALLVASVFVLHVPLNVVKAATFYRAVGAMMPGRAAELARLRGGFLRGTLAAPFVTIYALLATRKLTLIEWRGRRYEVRGPLDVRPL